MCEGVKLSEVEPHLSGTLEGRSAAATMVPLQMLMLRHTPLQSL